MIVSVRQEQRLGVAAFIAMIANREIPMMKLNVSTMLYDIVKNIGEL
jgi:hypothetical protein